VGAAWVEAMFAKPAALETPSEASAHELHSTVEALAATSLCGHGSGLAAFARSVLTHYGEEIDRWLG
jgi:hypothetical protein